MFADASEKAYGTAVYIRTSIDNKHVVRLLSAKSKVAPLKKITVPRLELSAAVLAVRLYKLVRQALTVHVNDVFFWSDSTIVLQWIQKEPSQLNTFVGNRVAEIQSHTESHSWRHVPTNLNPADYASRGAKPQTIVSSDLWWNGPTFLSKDRELWPTYARTLDPEFSLECKTTTVMSCTGIRSPQERNCDMLRRFSSWKKLIHTIAYCIRFIHKLRKQPTVLSTYLTVDEVVDQAETRVIQLVQQECFPEELIDLNKDNNVTRKSTLLKLHPFVDRDRKLIRVGGRLCQSTTLSTDAKHPIVLPSRHFITKLILRENHEVLGHCGSEQLLAITRLKYWPIHGKIIAKQICRSCIRCFRFKPSVPEYVMGNLPRVRVEQSRPFSSTGIDYAGPIMIRESRRKGRVHIFKAYIALFICLRTKAVHLELVTSLSTDSFIAALRRFISRRGLCSDLYSDRGTNFIGAFNELNAVYEFLKAHHKDIASRLTDLQIQWHFIPARAPHFGGIWEAAVKSFKRHFYRMTHTLTLTFEECYTLLTQIEAILNSRPLVATSSDVNNPSYLCPAHFLIGDYLLEPPSKTYSDIPDNRLSTYTHIQKIKEHFWKRWHTDYLQSLQERVKWKQGSHDIKIGDIVLIKEDNAAPLQWHLGRIEVIHPGSDDVIRAATVRTSSGEFTRPVKKLCKLPLE